MKNQTIYENNGIKYVEFSGLPSEMYGQTTAAGTVQQAMELGFLSCADGSDYTLNWYDKGDIMKAGAIIEVTEKRYYEMLEVLPPMYISVINGQKLSGFAVTEAQYHNKNGAVYSVYWKQDDKCFHAWCNLKDNNKNVMFSELHEYHTGIEANIVNNTKSV